MAKPNGSMILWQPAHTAFWRCSSMAWRIVSGLLRSLFSFKGGTFAGGGDGACRAAWRESTSRARQETCDSHST